MRQIEIKASKITGLIDILYTENGKDVAFGRSFLPIHSVNLVTPIAVRPTSELNVSWFQYPERLDFKVKFA